MTIFDFRKLRSFKVPLQSDHMLSLSWKKFSDETMKKVMWAKQMYGDWRLFRGSQENLKTYYCDLDDLSTFNKFELSEALCRFITEVKKFDCSDYPAKTLYDIIICLQFWLETQGLMWKLLNEDEFKDLRFTLDNLMKDCTAAGVGRCVRKAEVLSFDDEQVLWSRGILGDHSPEVLLHTVFFMLGLHCALRAGKEHRILHRIPFESQFQFKTDCKGETYIHYKEDLGLKTNKGGLKHRKIDPKEVDIYPCADRTHCPVAIISKYMSLLPKTSKSKALYLQPKRKFSSDCWYLDKPVGINTLHKAVKTMCDRASIDSYFTNHSLRSSSATRLYTNGIDEQVIQEITGHRSLAVRSYKRTCEAQKRKASQIVSGGVKKL